MKKFLFGICIFCILLLPSTNAINISNSEIKDLNFDNNVYVEPDKYLVSDHINHLIRSLPFIMDSEMKNIVLDIITEIKIKGYAESNNIQRIIENYDTDITSVYINSMIETTGHNGNCDGFVFCFPGLILSVFGPLKMAVAFAKYSYRSWDCGLDPFGWHLRINGEGTSKGSGFFIGYYGQVMLNPPFVTGWYFRLSGTALLIFHRTFL